MARCLASAADGLRRTLCSAAGRLSTQTIHQPGANPEVTVKTDDETYRAVGADAGAAVCLLRETYPVFADVRPRTDCTITAVAG